MVDVADRAAELAEEDRQRALNTALAKSARAADRQGAALCQSCGDPIPAARRAAVPGCRACQPCQTLQEERDR